MSEQHHAMFTRSSGVKIAYHHHSGKIPGVVFLGGYMSDMTSNKVTHLESHCKSQGRAFLRFDYSGHGQSDGQFVDGTIGSWAEDAGDLLNMLTQGPQILVGSSMGGWIALLLAQAYPDRVAGLLGIAAAPDFTEELMWDAFSASDKAILMETGMLEQANDYSDTPYRITRSLIEDGRDQLVLRQDSIAFSGPARFLHGTADTDVPYRFSQIAASKLQSENVRVDLIEGGDHRLSTPENLAQLSATLDELIGLVEGSTP